jgi:hypothetical protein
VSEVAYSINLSHINWIEVHVAFHTSTSSNIVKTCKYPANCDTMAESQNSGTTRGNHCQAMAWQTHFCSNKSIRNNIGTVGSGFFYAVLAKAIY